MNLIVEVGTQLQRNSIQFPEKENLLMELLPIGSILQIEEIKENDILAIVQEDVRFSPGTEKSLRLMKGTKVRLFKSFVTDTYFHVK